MNTTRPRGRGTPGRGAARGLGERGSTVGIRPAVDWPAVVIGAGQAGLATGYFLQQFDLEFTILADDERIGDPWRKRWDSLRLFTPAFYNHLPGMSFPADDPEYLPVKDELADYLEAYAEAFDLPVQLDTRVTRVQQEAGTFVLTTDVGSWSERATRGPRSPPRSPRTTEAGECGWWGRTSSGVRGSGPSSPGSTSTSFRTTGSRGTGVASWRRPLDCISWASHG